MAQALGRGLDLLQPQPWVRTVLFYSCLQGQLSLDGVMPPTIGARLQTYEMGAWQAPHPHRIFRVNSALHTL